MILLMMRNSFTKDKSGFKRGISVFYPYTMVGVNCLSDGKVSVANGFGLASVVRDSLSRKS